MGSNSNETNVLEGTPEVAPRRTNLAILVDVRNDLLHELRLLHDKDLLLRRVQLPVDDNSCTSEPESSVLD